MKDYLVGVYYFAGWWQEMPNKYHTDGRDWTTEYSGRVPLLGRYVDQATVDNEIEAASEHGVDFLQILWYPPLADPSLEPNAEHLNDGVRYFMASKNAHRMKFSVEYVNHIPFAIDSDRKWLSTCEMWAEWMHHPSYLRVDGRPVFKVHGIYQFYDQCGGDSELVATRIAMLRDVVMQSGLPNPLISAGVMPYDSANTLTSCFDFTTTYMDMPQIAVGDAPYPYTKLLSHASQAWIYQSANSNKPYMPYVPSGWDPRPWKDPRPSFMAPTESEWTDALSQVKNTLDLYQHLGIPSDQSGIQKAFIIYAWNEYGEGGIVAPTQGEQYMKLECINSVFGHQSNIR